MANNLSVNATSRNGITTVRILVRHAMETGMRRDRKTGKHIPPTYVKEIECVHATKKVLVAQLGPRVADNPYVQFRFKGGKPGETLTVRWTDTEAASESLNVRIG